MTTYDTDSSASELVTTAARPHPSRQQLAIYPVSTCIQTRYADLDTNAHLNNVALSALHEDIRARLNRRVLPDVFGGGREYRLVLSQNVFHFLAEGFWPDEVIAAAGVARIGRSSFVTSSALFVGDQCISIGDSTCVVVGETGPVSIPEEFRTSLRSCMIRADAEDG